MLVIGDGTKIESTNHQLRVTNHENKENAAMKQIVIFNLNGESVQVEIEPHLTLLQLLRDRVGLTGTKEGCGMGECGACTVLLDGKTVNSCIFPAIEVDGKSVTTIEGLTDAQGNLHPIQKAFIEYGAIQCGFCTPGMVLSAKALLDENPKPTEEEIRDGIAGNLCRCTGYLQIVQAIKAASERM
jgi:carbon-monoxide dehydrogenase small subunit